MSIWCVAIADHFIIRMNTIIILRVCSCCNYYMRLSCVTTDWPTVNLPCPFAPSTHHISVHMTAHAHTMPSFLCNIPLHHSRRPFLPHHLTAIIIKDTCAVNVGQPCETPQSTRTLNVILSQFSVMRYECVCVCVCAVSILQRLKSH